MYKPPYSISSNILQKVASISARLGEIKASYLDRPSPELRKKNRIRTIQSSLAIEGNTLSEGQITAIFDSKRVLGPEKDILEVKNAIEVYSRMNELEPFDEGAFLFAHKLLMNGLVESPGAYRKKSVGIMRGDKVAHVAPPAGRVTNLMQDLFQYAKDSEELMLIKSCVFHYEMEFIHPFEDGNGRMGRLWQTLLLLQEYPVFEFLPLETIIKDRQASYYQALSQSDKAGESSRFIEFMLGVIQDALEALLQQQQVTLTAEQRINRYHAIIKTDFFSRKDYMRFFKNISSATASRDLRKATEKGLLVKEGEKRLTVYRFKNL